MSESDVEVLDFVPAHSHRAQKQIRAQAAADLASDAAGPSTSHASLSRHELKRLSRQVEDEFERMLAARTSPPRASPMPDHMAWWRRPDSPEPKEEEARLDGLAQDVRTLRRHNPAFVTPEQMDLEERRLQIISDEDDEEPQRQPGRRKRPGKLFKRLRRYNEESKKRDAAEAQSREWTGPHLGPVGRHRAPVRIHGGNRGDDFSFLNSLMGTLPPCLNTPQQSAPNTSAPKPEPIIAQLIERCEANIVAPFASSTSSSPPKRAREVQHPRRAPRRRSSSSEYSWDEDDDYPCRGPR